jgi:hypothetical protein
VVTDLSRRGLGFETEAQVKDGELLFLKISLPVAIACRVRHTRGRGGANRCGGSIVRIGYLDRMKLESFIQAQAPTS